MFIPSEDIQRTGRKLGKGQFGVASVAVFMNREVCVKTHHIEWDVFPSSNASVQYGTYGQTNHNGRQDALYGGSMASGRMRINEDLFKDIFNEALAMKAGLQILKKNISRSLQNLLFLFYYNPD